MASDIWELF